VVCELLLRGPQTPGELRSHASRLTPIADVREVETALEDLMTRPEGPYAARLPREPGKRESRFAQLFTGPAPAEVDEAQLNEARSEDDLAERVARLEARLALLEAELGSLKSRS
ncbi:MAG TPA: DUF480 domain-containing protein, partial [Steroidobacteraceae bacterium]|nr:DUF480 domain-containing protein [Steroidobacteraceae bacterium]